MLADVVVVVAVVGYLLGSIPVADLIARRTRERDLRTVGDRNPGYWNAKEQFGRRAALPVLLGDVAKGTVAAGFGAAVAGPGQWWFTVVGTGAAMVGHCWPVFARFRGGRGVATFVGGAIVMSPPSALIGFAVLVAVWAASRSFAWGVRAGFAAFPCAQLLVDGPVPVAATGALMTLIGIRFATATRSARRVGPASPSLPARDDSTGERGHGDDIGRR